MNHDREWQAAAQTLRSADWTVQITCTAAPVQIEGRLPSGERFYLRARHDEVMLAIGGDDPAEAPEWVGMFTYGEVGGYAASYLPADQGLAIIVHLAQQFGEGAPSADR